MPTSDEIFDSVKEILIEALACDDDEVTSGATLVGDLGAESIDFLDIVFNLEQNFSIEIPRSELFPEDILTNDEFVTDGNVTEVGLAALGERMPFINLSNFRMDPRVQDFGNLMTVGDLCKYIEGKTS